MTTKVIDLAKYRAERRERELGLSGAFAEWLYERALRELRKAYYMPRLVKSTKEDHK